MRAPILQSLPPERRLARLCVLGLLWLTGLGFAVGAVAQEPPGNLLPPTLNYNPAAGSTINFTGVGAIGSNGSASITVTPVGGVGSGPAATVGLGCALTGPDAANFTVSPTNSSYQPGNPPATLTLGCTSGASIRTANLFCNETPAGNTGPVRNWTLSCPAGTPSQPPNLAYNPTPGTTINFSGASNLIGSTATAAITITPSGGSGSGIAATRNFSNCTLSNESTAGTFSGFQSVNFSFVGNTALPRTVNLSATIRAVPVTATLNCLESLPGGGGRGSPGSQIRSWPLSLAAGVPPAQLAISKTASASQVAAGSTFSFEVNVTNAQGSGAQSGLVLIDEVPAALTVLGASGAGWTCTLDGNLVDCRRPSLALGASASVTIDVRAPMQAQAVVNTARVTSIQVPNPATSTTSVQVLATPPVNIDLRVDKRDSVDPVLAGAEFSYFIDVTNVGSNPATGVTITDALPSTLQFLSASGPGWTCSGSSVISCSLAGTLAPGAVSGVTIQVRAPTEAQLLTNRAEVSADQNDVNPGNNSATETTEVRLTPPPPPDPQADLVLAATATPASALTGQAVQLVVDVSNRGPDPASSAVLGGTLSNAFAAITAVSGNGWNCSASGQSFQCTRASIAVNTASQVRVDTAIRLGASGAAQAGFSVSAATADPVTANNTAQVSVPFQSSGADLAISKSDSVDPVRAGGEFFYTLAISNAGPEPATGVRVSDPLPASLTFLSASGPGFACVREGQIVTCTLAGSLAAGATASVVINVRAPTSGQTVINEAFVGADTSDPNPANNRASQSTTINERTAQDIAQLLDAAAVDPTSRAAVGVVAEECVVGRETFGQACRDIIRAAEEGRTGEVGDALRAIAPEEVLAQSLVLREIGTTQFFNVDARLNELRRGGGGFSASGLTVNVDGQALPVALLNDALRQALGFGGDDFGGLISPWGFFINGNISSGKQDLNLARGNTGVDFDSRGITAGVDYRFSNRMVAGAAIGYANFDADISGGSSLDTRGLLLTGYGSYYLNERLYWDSRISYGRIDLEQQRRIRFQLGGTTYDALASGKTDASQLTLASALGYHLNYGPWSVTPSASLRLIRNEIDAFAETGAGAYNVAYRDQSYDTTQFALGVQVSRALSMATGVLLPQFDLNFHNESGDKPSAEARLIQGSGSSLFRLQEESPDSSYGTVGLGFTYLMGNGRQAYLHYRRTFGFDDFDRGSLNLGGRFEF